MTNRERGQSGAGRPHEGRYRYGQQQITRDINGDGE